MTHCEFHIFQTLSRATSIKLLPLAHRAAKISPTAQNRDNILHSRRKKLYVKCVYVFDGVGDWERGTEKENIQYKPCVIVALKWDFPVSISYMLINKHVEKY